MNKFQKPWRHFRASLLRIPSFRKRQGRATVVSAPPPLPRLRLAPLTHASAGCDVTDAFARGLHVFILHIVPFIENSCVSGTVPHLPCFVLTQLHFWGCLLRTDTYSPSGFILSLRHGVPFMITPSIDLLPSWWMFKIVYILIRIFFYMFVPVPVFLSRVYLDWASWQKAGRTFTTWKRFQVLPNSRE